MTIKVNHLVKEFDSGKYQVLKGVSFEIADGDFVAITGKSGSGKSTLMYIMSTLDTPTSGQIFYDGHDIFALSTQDLHAYRNQNIGFVFQFHYLLPDLTVLENILMPTLKTQQKNNKKKFALELLESFGIANKANHFPAQISGGERQRAAIARALIMNPKYIYADEPTGNLDTTNADNVMRIFSEVNQQQKTTIIMVTHDLDYAKAATRQIFLVDGHLG